MTAKRNFLKKYWFLLGLAVALGIGSTQATRLQAVSDASWFSQMLVFVSMFAMSLPVRRSALGAAILRPQAALLAITGNLLLVPLLAWLVAPLLPAPLAAGLLVTAAVPCTLASAAVLARRAGGDPTVCILTTLVTNGICFLYTPAALAVLLPDQGKTDLNFWSTATQLLILIVLPMFLAQVLRLHGKTANWSDRHSSSLSLLSQACILLMVLVSSIQMGLRWRREGGADELSFWPLLSVILAVVAVHVAALYAVWIVARMLKIQREQQIGAALAGSQKTLMVGLQIAVSPGLDISILPMIAFHVCQLLIDTLLSNRWKETT